MPNEIGVRIKILCNKNKNNSIIYGKTEGYRKPHQLTHPVFLYFCVTCRFGILPSAKTFCWHLSWARIHYNFGEDCWSPPGTCKLFTMGVFNSVLITFAFILQLRQQIAVAVTVASQQHLTAQDSLLYLTEKSASPLRNTSDNGYNFAKHVVALNV